jgi:hypothetical protein
MIAHGILRQSRPNFTLGSAIIRIDTLRERRRSKDAVRGDERKRDEDQLESKGCH